FRLKIPDIADLICEICAICGCLPPGEGLDEQDEIKTRPEYRSSGLRRGPLRNGDEGAGLLQFAESSSYHGVSRLLWEKTEKVLRSLKSESWLTITYPWSRTKFQTSRSGARSSAIW